MTSQTARIHGLLARLGLALVLVLTQVGALRHAYSHFGIVPDPYAVGETHTPPVQGCDLGVVHAALDGDPPSATMVLLLRIPPEVPTTVAVASFIPRLVPSFQSRAPPARA